MRVLITGHRGYIGSALVPLMLAEGFDIVGMDSCIFERCTFGKDSPTIPELRKDIRDAEREDLKGFDAVVHLAALSNDPLGNLNADLTYDINHRASVRLAELARAEGVSRFIFSSSCSVYGAAGQDSVGENAEFNPVTPYGESKVWTERDIAPMVTDEFSPVFMRNATAYGLSPRHRFDLVLNNLMAWAMTTGRVFMKSDGTPWRPIVHIDDISGAVMAALRAPTEMIHNEAFNVGFEEENYQIKELAEIVRDLTKNTRIDYAEGAGPDKRSYRVSFAKVRKHLPDFTQRWNARAGAEQLLGAYNNAALTVEDVEGIRFNRIDHVEWLLKEGLLDETLRTTERAR